MNRLLDRATAADVRLEPFPHLVLTDALPEALCNALLRSFPSTQWFAGEARPGSNRRYDLSRKTIRERKLPMDPLWSEFLDAQADDAFLAAFLKLFGGPIEREYPGLLASWGGPEGVRRGDRSEDAAGAHHILTEAYASINTPSRAGDPSVRVPHVDDPRKLYAGLFYMRHPDDDADGGDLELYESTDKDLRFWRQDAEPKKMRVVKTVKYAKNVLVLVLNTARSLHVVTPRGAARLPRYFVNLVGETPSPLFDLKARQMPWPRGWWHALGRRMSGAGGYR